MKSATVVALIAATAIAWGVYAPVVQIAAEKLGSELRAFLLVGVAYFLVGVLVPTAFILSGSDPTVRSQADESSAPKFDRVGVTWGLAAGFSGAVGAVCMIFALAKAGSGAAIFVAPVVFAAVPIVNTVAALLWFAPTSERPGWQFFLGLALASAGAVLILVYKPASTADNTISATAPVAANTDSRQ